MNPFFLRTRTGLGGKITSFLNRPKVELDFKEEENYVVRNVNDRILEIRLKIINNGLTTAKRTNVKLESVIQGEMNVLTRDPHENYFKLNISDEDLQNGDYKFIELIKKRGTVKEGRKKIELFTKTDQKIDEHDVVFNIVVTGEYFPAFKKNLLNTNIMKTLEKQSFMNYQNSPIIIEPIFNALFNTRGKS